MLGLNTGKCDCGRLCTELYYKQHCASSYEICCFCSTPQPPLYPLLILVKHSANFSHTGNREWVKSVRIPANHWMSRGEISTVLLLLNCGPRCITGAVSVLEGIVNWGCCKRLGRARAEGKGHRATAELVVLLREQSPPLILQSCFSCGFGHHIYSLFYLCAALQNQTLSEICKTHPFTWQACDRQWPLKQNPHYYSCI